MVNQWVLTPYWEGKPWFFNNGVFMLFVCLTFVSVMMWYRLGEGALDPLSNVSGTYGVGL